MNTAGREILWNVNSASTVIVMYGMMIVSMVIAGIGIVRRAEVWTAGTPCDERLGRWGTRLKDLFTGAFAQRKVVRERIPAFAHTLIYLGMVVLLFTTTMVFLDHDLGFEIYRGRFYLAVTVLSDLFGLGVLIGCGAAAYRRYIKAPDALHTRAADTIALAALALLALQGFLLEGLRIHVTADPWAQYSPVGKLAGAFFWSLTDNAASILHRFLWWFHTITVFAGIAVIPYTKLFHILSSSLNIYFKDSGRPKGALPFPGDIESMLEAGEDFSIGFGTIKDYSWKHMLDLDACTSCGRCQNVCPAYLSGKPLSPKWLILDTRSHALALSARGDLAPSHLPGPLRKLDGLLTSRLLLASSGIEREGEYFKAAGDYRASNKLVHTSVLSLGANAQDRIAGEVIRQDVFWACTTCMACVSECPVEINHVEHILENRRNMVLMEGEIPSEARQTLKALETRGNPFGAPEDRANWVIDQGVKILEPGDSVEYLYWVGCVSSYDLRKQKIAKAFVKLMQEAGCNFGILGSAEQCTGDPARRLGEENLFQTLAKSNLEILSGITFKTIVCTCPHCFNTLLNEYPQLGHLGSGIEKPEVIHHSVLLKRLMDSGKLKIKDSNDSITFHDPCYLGRYNDTFEAPRSVLQKNSSLKILEMEKSRRKAMCCGAGGGHFWMDMKAGERINSIRIKQAEETTADEVATACPFCLHMLEDGVTLTESRMKVKDIAEILVERVVK